MSYVTLKKIADVPTHLREVYKRNIFNFGSTDVFDTRFSWDVLSKADDYYLTVHSFSQAVYTNKFWNNFFNKKVTLLKIPIFVFAMLVMLIFSLIYFGWVWLCSINIIAEKAFDPGILIVIPIFTIFAGIPFLTIYRQGCFPINALYHTF